MRQAVLLMGVHRNDERTPLVERECVMRGPRRHRQSLAKWAVTVKDANDRSCRPEVMAQRIQQRKCHGGKPTWWEPKEAK
jgi:hypothetical protein